MNSTEKKNYIRDYAAQKFINDNPDALAVVDKDYTFVVPVQFPDGTTAWARCGITSCQMEDTKVRPGFNPDTDAIPAQEAFNNMLAERAANKAAKEQKQKNKKSVEE